MEFAHDEQAGWHTQWMATYFLARLFPPVDGRATHSQECERHGASSHAYHTGSRSQCRPSPRQALGIHRESAPLIAWPRNSSWIAPPSDGLLQHGPIWSQGASR
jgi:hypothetical protein